MAKKRVYELAKQLNISTKELIDKLKDLGIEVNNHMSTVDEENAALVEELIKGEKEDPKKPEKTEEKPKEKAAPEKKKAPEKSGPADSGDQSAEETAGTEA